MRLRLVGVFVGITLVVLAAHDLPLAAHLRRVERDAIVTALERDAFTIVGRAEESLEDATALGSAGLQSMVDDYRAQQGARVIITDTHGTAMVISDEEANAGADYSSRPEIASAMDGNPVSGTRYSNTLDEELLYVAVPVLSGNDVEGTVRLTFPASAVDERVDRRVRGLLAVALISLATAAIAAIVLAGTVTRPLRRVRAATERASQGELGVRAPTDAGPSEVRSLARSFNTMSERIAGLLDEQRAFAGDASHQLRTPLTALRLRLDQAAELTETDPELARERLDAAGQEVERLQHLVDGLLALARGEGRAQVPHRIDVVALVRERVEVWEPLATEHDVAVVIEAPDTAWALSVPGALEQIVDNYIDNALAVAPSGSTITVRVAFDGGRVVVHVLDEGAGMTDEQLARAFDRFWRAPSATVGGTGLGLAIVSQLARAGGAQATLAHRPGGGVDAAVSLPS